MGSDLGTIPERCLPPQSEIDATYKSRELEGIVDLFFYRRIGFGLAKCFARLNFTPTAVTLMGGAFGIVAGHLYFYQALAINLIGMLFHVMANIFDNADGQLARLTNQQSRTGRILDAVVDHVIWLSIYVHLGLRLQLEGFSGAVWLLALAAGISHGAQAVAADYWRNAYLYFGKGRGEVEAATAIAAEYSRYTWHANAWTKFLLASYLSVTREQEFLLSGLRRLRDQAQNFSATFQATYAVLALPTFKWWSLLMTNSRMLVLFVLLLIRQPVWYFWLELTAGNLLLVYLIFRQEWISRSLIQFLTTQKDSA